MSDNQNINANFDQNVDVKDVKFNFRTVKDEATGLESKRPSVELSIPIPSVEGIIAILEAGGKQLELLQEAVAEIVINRAREIVSDKEDISADNFPFAELTWEAIANLPKAERKGRGIAKEIWEDFSKDYIATMPAVTGKSAEQVGNAAKILLNKFSAVKSNKPVISLLKNQLGLYLNSSANAEQFSDCVEFLMQKAQTLLDADEAALLSNL
jgi:hypothetical protein